MDEMIYTVHTLAAAFYFLTDDPKYSSKAGAELLQVWFLNNDTRMKPHLKYAEIVRGKNKTYPELSWLEET